MSLWIAVLLKCLTCGTLEYLPPCRKASSVEVKFYTDKAQAEKALEGGAEVWRIGRPYCRQDKDALAGFSCEKLTIHKLKRESETKFRVVEEEVGR